MAQHIDAVSLTRDHLIHRLVNALNDSRNRRGETHMTTYAQIDATYADKNLEQLRSLVEAWEPEPPRGDHGSYADSLRTTEVHGIAR